MEYTSPAGRKGEREAEDSDIGLKERPQSCSASEHVQTVTRHYSHEQILNSDQVSNMNIYIYNMHKQYFKSYQHIEDV